MDRTMGLLEGQMMGTLGQEIISTRQEKLAKLAQTFGTNGCATGFTAVQRRHSPRSRMPESGKSGSVGAAGEQSPAATRQLDPSLEEVPRGGLEFTG